MTSTFLRRALVTALLLAIFGGVTPFIPATLERAEAQVPTQEWPSGEEVVSRRSENAKVFRQPDGTYTARMFTEPIHFLNGQGQWQDIVTTLVPSQASGFAWENSAGRFSVRFAPSARQSGMVSISQGGDSLEFGVEGANNASQPIVDGNTIVYPDVYPGIDIRYEVENDGVKELLVLDQPPAGTEANVAFRFPLSLTGFDAAEVAGGAIDITDAATGELEFTLPKLFMYDSAVLPGSGDAAFSEATFATLEGSGSTLAAEVTADASWLRDPARVYPVYIDPSFFNKTPSLDTYVQSNINNTPQNGMDELKSGTYDGSVRAKSLLKFDLAAIPNNSAINSATLSLYNFHSWDCNSHGTEVYRITESWGSGVVWPGPGFAASPADVNNNSYGNVCPANRLHFGVQSIIQYWKNSAANNDGFGIKAANMDNVTSWKKFRSNESSFPPYLDVNWTDPNNPPNEPFQNSPSGGVTTGPFPNLNATYRDPDTGDSGHVDFEIYQSGTCCGNPFRWGNGTHVNPGNNSTWTPSNSLPTGSYAWRARSNDGVATSGWTSTVSFNVDATAPSAPSITSAPSSPSNNRNPSWSFSGESGATFQCRLTRSGTTVFDWASCSSSRSYSLSGQPDGTYTFEVRQTDSFGNGPSGSAASNYTLDATAPSAPALTSVPSSPSNNRNPSWSFTGESGASFQCRLTRSGTIISDWSGCSSPKSYGLTGQPDGTYTFEVRQTDSLGNGPSTAATNSYVLDSTVFAPSITSSPSSPSNNRNPSWSFTGESGASFQCRLTRSGTIISDWAGCSSPRSYGLTGQPDGTYTFEVRQTDQAANGPSAAASSNFTLDTTVPAAPSITSSPSSPSNNRNPSWSFSGEFGATFQCRLTRSGTTVFDWASCSSPRSYGLTGQPDGTYTFEVRQTDQAGNGPSAAASTSYLLDTTVPAAPAITNAPTSPSNNATPSWSFTGESGAAFQCRLTRSATIISDWAGCTSAKSYGLTGQPDGTYTFEVRQTDQAGNGPSAAASSLYTFDTTAPAAPAITNAPASPSNNVNPSWSFTGESGATFQCRLTRGLTTISDWAGCTSAKTYSLTGQGDGTYTFQVRQTDRATNGPSAVASSNYALDTTAPSAPTITSSPPTPSTGRNPSWSFTGEAGGSFSCRLTRPGTTVFDWASCSSPRSYDLTGQPDATYTFEVRQTDQVGNGPSSPASSGFMLDSTPPAAPAVTSSTHPDPTETYTNDDPAFSWTASDVSGVAGYSYVLDQEPATVPDTVSEGTAQSRSYVDLSDGTWWFHVAARDNAGLWSAPAHFEIAVDLPAAMPQSLLVSPRQIYPADLPLLGRPSSARIHARVSGAGWQVQVLTPTGQTVRTFNAPAGASTTTWNGRDAAGVIVPDGPYEIRLRSVTDRELNGDSAWVTVGDGPAITAVTPGSATLNEEIVITGNRFTSEAGGFGVTIGGYEADVVSWSPTSIHAVVPVDLDAGPHDVVVTAADRDSTPATLTVENYLIDPEAPAEGYIRVKVNDGVSPAAVALTHGDTVLEQLLPDETDPELLRWWDVSVPVGSEASKVLEYASDPNVEWAETEVFRDSHATPNDDHFDQYQWNLHQPGDDYDIDAPEAWDKTKGSTNVMIAVVDSDVRSHPDLSTNLAGIRSFTDGCPDKYFSHGTHVAGIAAADTNNGQGVAGVGWNTRVFGYETGYVHDVGTPKEDCDPKGKHTFRGISHASLNGRDVINMSYGSKGTSEAEKEVIRKAWNRGLVLVASAGNEGLPKAKRFPAALPNVVSVGASTKNGTIAGYSNHGPWIDVYAPGGHDSGQLNTMIAAPSWEDGVGGTWWATGTSMAAPAVAGIAGLLKSHDPAATNGAIASAIQASVEGSPKIVSATKAIAKLVDIRLPNGIFVRGENGSKVWFVDDNQRHEVHSDVLNSWGIPASKSPLVAAVPSALLQERPVDRDRRLGFRPGKLISPTDSDNIFFISTNSATAGESWTRGQRLPMSTTTMTCLGYTVEEDVVEVRPAAMLGNPLGPEWTDCTRHPNGAVIQDGTRPSILQNDRRRNIQTDSVLDSWGMAEDVVPSLLGDTLLPAGDPLGLRPGTVARFRENGPVWFITSAGSDFARGEKRQFERPSARSCYGFQRLSPRFAVEGDVGQLHANGTVLKC